MIKDFIKHFDATPGPEFIKQGQGLSQKFENIQIDLKPAICENM